MFNNYLNDIIKFKHDCDTCVFVGHALNSDLYFCEAGKNVIARYGNDGPDYVSGMAMVEHDIRLAVALGLACTKGLLV